MWRLVAVLGAVCGVVAVFLPGGAIRPDRPDVGVAVVAGGLVVAAALSFAGARVGRVLGVVVAGVAAGFAVVWLVGDVASGAPGSGTPVLVVGAVVAVVTGVLAVLGRAAVGPVVAAAVVVVVAGGAVAGAVVVPGSRTESVTAGQVTPAAVTGKPTGERWQWKAPSSPRAVVAAGAGVVVATVDGRVTALDGRTGAVRWSYLRRGTHVRDLVATPGGGLVLVALAPGGPRDTGSNLLVVLDVVTGAVVHEQVVDALLSDVDGLTPTADVLPLRERQGDDFATTATDLRTGEQLWTWTAPAGCRSDFALPASGRDVALAPFECPDRIGVVALDQRTGRQRWERALGLDPTISSDEVPRFMLAASPDGDVVSVRLTSPRATTSEDVLLRADTGALLTSVDGGLFPRLDTGPVPVLELQTNAQPTRSEAVDPNTGTTTPLDLTACPNRIADATTMSTYLRVCDTTSLVWQPLTGGPASTAPLDRPESESAIGGLLGGGTTALVPAPGAVVVARATDLAVTGFPTS